MTTGRVPPPPRTLLRGLLALGAALVAVACGFQLRGDFRYPFSTIYLNVPAGSPIVQDLKRTLEGAGGARVLDSAAAAEVILDVQTPVDEKSVLALSGGGKVREYALTKRVSYRLYDAAGREWLPGSQIVLRRSYTISETEILAREYEEVRLLKEMQGDAVQQIARRLQAAKRPS